METNNERRRRKLKILRSAHGLEAIASKADLSAQSLDQILKGVLLPVRGDGSRSERALGDDAARAIESAFDLGRGWFDNDEEESSMTSDELLLLGYFRKLDADMQAIVVDNVREAVEERARMKERMRLSKVRPAGDQFAGSADSAFGGLADTTKPRKKPGQ